ncbi:hypothetical protein PIB30_108193, partial [Stylosanthes scabra]|nr:hypothetical protein [Stylosanthes scabra]
METVRGGAVPLLRGPNQEAEEHNEGPRQEEEGNHEEVNHEEEVEIDQEGDEEMHDVEAVYHSPQPQPNMEHESGIPCLMDYEAHYEEQQQHYYEPPNSPPSQQQQPPQQHHPQSQPPQPPSQAILDLKVLQEQQQQGFNTMTELVADSQNKVLNYYEKIKEYQEYQYDQMKAIIAQQQEIIQTQNREVQVMKSRHDKMEKELSEIRQAQVNLALYKTSSRSQIEDGTKEELQRLKKIIEEQRVALAQQSRASAGSSQLLSTSAQSIEEKLEEIASIVKLFKEDLAAFKERHKQLAELSLKQFHKIRKEQTETAQEVKEIKERQINPVDDQTLKDVAKMTFQQRKELEIMRKQMREWTMYSSVRECYDVWAHQQVNPNLVSMPLHDITKMVYNNLEAKKPMFLGALKTDPNPG